MHPVRKPLRFSNAKEEKLHNGPNCLTQNGKCCKRWTFIVIFSFPIKVMKQKKYRSKKRKNEQFLTANLGLSPSKRIFYLLQWKPYKNNEKYFLFHLKSSFGSQDIKIFFLTFWSCSRNDLIRKIRLISKFLLSQWLTNNFNTHLPSISKSKGSHRFKFGQVI